MLGLTITSAPFPTKASIPPSAATAAAVMSAGLEPRATASGGCSRRVPAAEGSGEARRPSFGGSAAGCEPQPAATSAAPAAVMPAILRNSLRL